MAGEGFIIFLLFVGFAIMLIAKAQANKNKKEKREKHKYRPYRPINVDQDQKMGHEQSVQSPGTRGIYQTRYSYSDTQNDQQRRQPNKRTETRPRERAAYASADEYYREGMFDQAKDEYLKTGRIFGAAKSLAAKGVEYHEEAIDLIQRYAPEREEEMVRNLSRYFFDSGDIEAAGSILHRYGLENEAAAVLATINKNYADLYGGETVEVSPIFETEHDDEDVFVQTQQSLEELESLTQEVSSIGEPEESFTKMEEETIREDKELKRKRPAPQKLKIATSKLEGRCSVCMSSIEAGESFVRCPFCEVPSHYSHIIEWIKVKPQCPNCRRKLTAGMFTY